MADETVKIIADTRELRTTVVKSLFDMGAKIENSMLPVGDFILSERVVAERKSVSDFLQSIIDGRLFVQIQNLVSQFERPIMIVEGNEDIYEKRMMHPNAIRGAIAALAIDFRIPIIYTTCEHETAMFLFLIAQREQIDKKVSISLHGEKKPQSDRYLQEYIVTSFPGIGQGIAQNLLKHFKTIKNIVNADVKGLQEVEKIGKLKAHKIKSIVEAEYKEESPDKKKSQNLL
ncbi:MAG: ERCC4 domain-containing protein [Candidatus Nanoarchaeia archaeon]|nr:ERCC4 domain-containing protein [Candidatus Nanoarchaeia archaeon]MDD5239369.1 ERCC4 domain-containing protein [Candidatus Nanoarchaeia archaeon]